MPHAALLIDMLARWCSQAHLGLKILLGALTAFLITGAAHADTPGDFDFYVLSLSWSPTYCQDQGRGDRVQCGSRPYAFIVHGLWPQYERGFPRDCPSNLQNFVPRDTVQTMLDIMPSPSLIRHEWQQHGTCTGLSQPAYFNLVRRARSAVVIPDEFVDPQDYVTVSPKTIEAEFIAANPGLRKDAIAVSCDARRVKEVRICLTRDLKFRSCPEVDRGACRRDRLVMPPVR